MENQLNRFAVARRHVRAARRALRRGLGGAGLTGVALLAAAGIALLYAPQVLHEADTMHIAVDRTRAQLSEIEQELSSKPGSVRQIDRFRDWLPAVEQSTADLRALFEIADKSQIQLS